MKQRNSMTTNSSSSKMTTSFDSMFKFSNNKQILFAMIPLILLFLYIGGTTTIYISTLMIFLIYISEYLNFPPLTLISIWLGLFLANLSILFQGFILVQHSLINGILLMNIAFSMGMMGIWMTLQFSWFTSKYSTIAIMMERILFSNLIYPTSILLTWCTVVVSGIESAPYYLTGFQFLYYFIFGLPTRSFKVRSSKQVLSTTDFILGRLDSGLMVMSVIIFPSLLYFSIYHYVFFQSIQHLVNTLLLLSSSCVYIFLLSKYGSLWWLVPNYWNQRLNIKKFETGDNSGSTSNSILNKSYSFIFGIGNTVKIICMLVLVGCLEYRVLINSPSFYTVIHNLSPRFGFLVVTLGLYSFSTIFYFIFMGVESSFNNNSTTIPAYYQHIISVISCIFSITISLLLSTPLYIIPFSIISSLSIINYLFKKKSISLLIFIISSCIYLIWFLNTNYLFISYRFFNSYPVSDLSLTVICGLMVLLFSSSMLMVYSSATSSTGVFQLLVILQSVILTTLEISLHSTKNTIYPIYYIVATSLLIIYLNSKLLESKLITNSIGMISNSIMISKLFALIFTPLNENILACFMFTLLFYMTYQPPTLNLTNVNGASSGVVSNFNIIDKKKLYLQMLFSTFVSFVFNKQITIRFLNLFISGGGIGYGYYEDSDDSNIIILIAGFLLTFGTSIIPICFRSISPLKRFKNLNVLILFTSFLLLILNPTNTSGKLNNSGSSGLLWTNWLLFATVLLFIIGYGKRISISKSKKLKLIFSFLFGTFFGIYICLNYFIKSTMSMTNSSSVYLKLIKAGNGGMVGGIENIDLLLNFGFILLFSLVSYFFCQVQWPSNYKSSSDMEGIYIAIIMLFAGEYYLLTSKYSSFTTTTNHIQSLQQLESTRLSLLGLFIGVNLLISIYLKFHTKQSIQHQLSTTNKSQYNYYQSPVKQQQRQKEKEGGSGGSVGSNVTNSYLNVNSWIYTIGNWCCIISFALSVYVGYLLGYSEKAVFILSPILLLLVTDKGWIKKAMLHESHRYLPMVFTLSSFLFVSSLIHLLSDSNHIQLSTMWLYKYIGVKSYSTIRFWWLLKNWVMFILILPSIEYLIKYLFKQQTTNSNIKKRSTNSTSSSSSISTLSLFSPFIQIPILILSCILSDIISIQLYSLISLIGQIVLKYKITKIENKGNQLI